MAKPITVARQDFTEQILELVNKAELPAFVIAEVLEKLTAQMNQLALIQYQQDAQAYEAQKAQEAHKAQEERLAQKAQEVQEVKK